MRLEDAIAMGGEYEREARAMEWACEHGESYRVECIDGWFGWRYSVKGGRIRRWLEIDFRALRHRVGDNLRWCAMKARIARNRLTGKRNPYLKEN